MAAFAKDQENSVMRKVYHNRTCNRHCNHPVQKEGIMNKIYLSSPTIHEEELRFVNEAFEKNWVAPVGFNIDTLEK